MVISDLPAGDYRVQVIVNGDAYQLKVTVFPGRVTFFSMHGTYGFSTKPPPIPTIFTTTPTPAR